MGTKRTSTKDILDAVNAQSEQITALIEVLKGIASPAPYPPAPVPVPTVHEEVAPIETVTSAKIDEQYSTVMLAKTQAYATDKGETAILYTAKNLAGELKLRFCRGSDFPKKTGVIDLIATCQPG